MNPICVSLVVELSGDPNDLSSFITSIGCVSRIIDKSNNSVGGESHSSICRSAQPAISALSKYPTSYPQRNMSASIDLSFDTVIQRQNRSTFVTGLPSPHTT